MREELVAEIARIAAIGDLDEQARAVGRLMHELGIARKEASALRSMIVAKLRERERSHGEIAELLGIKRGTAQQIAEGRQRGTTKAREGPEDSGDGSA